MTRNARPYLTGNTHLQGGDQTEHSPLRREDSKNLEEILSSLRVFAVCLALQSCDPNLRKVPNSCLFSQSLPKDSIPWNFHLLHGLIAGKTSGKQIFMKIPAHQTIEETLT